MGFSFSVVLLLVVIVNMTMTMNYKKYDQKFTTQYHISNTPQFKNNNHPLQKITISRVNTFQYLSYILTNEEEILKEKLIKRYALNYKKAEQYAKIIAKVSDEHDIPSDLLAALIRTESNYSNKAVSHKKAIGPTQIIARYWKKDCAENLFDIANNIQCAAIILTQYKERCRNNWSCALKMYNIGPTNYYKKNAFYNKAGLRYLTKITHNLKLLNS
jgi:hypothetical protein